MIALAAQRLLANKHTTGAGIAYLIASGLETLGPLWIPSKTHEFQLTAKWIHGIAVMYGLGMAGDAKQPDKSLTGNGDSANPKP